MPPPGRRCRRRGAGPLRACLQHAQRPNTLPSAIELLHTPAPAPCASRFSARHSAAWAPHPAPASLRDRSIPANALTMASGSCNARGAGAGGSAGHRVYAQAARDPAFQISSVNTSFCVREGLYCGGHTRRTAPEVLSSLSWSQAAASRAAGEPEVVQGHPTQILQPRGRDCNGADRRGHPAMTCRREGYSLSSGAH